MLAKSFVRQSSEDVTIRMILVLIPEDLPHNGNGHLDFFGNISKRKFLLVDEEDDQTVPQQITLHGLL